jgi:hypothetical protein
MAQESGVPGDKAELLERIRRSRAALENTLQNRSEAELTAPGSEGWSVKDHLSHLAVWELGVVELLKRRPRFAAMQIDEALYQKRDYDTINAQIQQKYAARSLAEVMQLFESSHQGMLSVLDGMEDKDLFKPYASYVPEGSQASQDPVINWIIGDTYEHFDAHAGYIAGILAETRPG